MRNFVAYFYNIMVDKFSLNNNYYSFNYNGYLYHLIITDNNLNINMLVDINKQMLNNTLISEIIINKDGKYISNYNDTNYVLIKVYVNPNKNMSLEEINYLANSLYSKNNKTNWGILWSNKIDYLENLINENRKKYPLIAYSFNYFVGMAENAISYYNNINIKNNSTYVVSHRTIRFDDTALALYNPLNIIFDYPARDVAEYIKNSFFINNNRIFNELDLYIQHNKLTNIDAMLIISRVLYPSFYFEMYEDILIYNQSELIITEITNKLPIYERYLAKVINYFRKYYDVPDVNWLNRKNED